ncbi:uncharacterized protein CLUP02_08520 [Colletotrichum lupini]|uniref:Uncharacterized protein n=1 Tax=Colletotrichum lupini TaxID=145971 RepID=A0A9Q8WHQ4_9PEZI|nr:uncharacterized protein CLUP02_08520 [Colletotrichum lupini]UQC83030.1 hypothetical protein CLUP02_08520 [Colletotrichum lupini]
MLHRRRFVKTSTVNHSQRDVDVAPFQIPSTSRKAQCPSKHALMSFRKPYQPVAIGCLVAVSVACHTLILHFSNLNYHDPFLSRTLRRPLSSNVACRMLHRAGNPTFDSNHVHVQVGVSERPFTAPGPSGSVPYIRFHGISNTMPRFNPTNASCIFGLIVDNATAKHQAQLWDVSKTLDSSPRRRPPGLSSTPYDTRRSEVWISLPLLTGRCRRNTAADGRPPRTTSHTFNPPELLVNTLAGAYPYYLHTKATPQRKAYYQTSNDLRLPALTRSSLGLSASTNRNCRVGSMGLIFEPQRCDATRHVSVACSPLCSGDTRLLSQYFPHSQAAAFLAEASRKRMEEGNRCNVPQAALPVKGDERYSTQGMAVLTATPTTKKRQRRYSPPVFFRSDKEHPISVASPNSPAERHDPSRPVVDGVLFIGIANWLDLPTCSTRSFAFTLVCCGPRQTTLTLGQGQSRRSANNVRSGEAQDGDFPVLTIPSPQIAPLGSHPTNVGHIPSGDRRLGEGKKTLRCLFSHLDLATFHPDRPTMADLDVLRARIHAEFSTGRSMRFRMVCFPRGSLQCQENTVTSSELRPYNGTLYIVGASNQVNAPGAALPSKRGNDTDYSEYSHPSVVRSSTCRDWARYCRPAFHLVHERLRQGANGWTMRLSFASLPSLVISSEHIFCSQEYASK